MIAHTITQLAADTQTLAIEFDIQPELPPFAKGLVRLVNWLLWGAILASAAALVYAGGKMGWEKWSTGQIESAKMVAGAAVGAVISLSAQQILNAVTA
jgi:hypothetical protein